MRSSDIPKVHEKALEGANKERISLYNRDCIASLTQGLVKYIRQTPIAELENAETVNSQIVLRDREGTIRECEWNLQISSDQEKVDVNLNFYYKFDSRNDFVPRVCHRQYTFHVSSMRDDRIECTSYLHIDPKLRGVDIGKSLLKNGEDIKLEIAEKISKKYGFSSVQSIIEDESYPVGWSGSMALELGYSQTDEVKIHYDEDGKLVILPTYFRIDPLISHVISSDPRA